MLNQPRIRVAAVIGLVLLSLSACRLSKDTEKYTEPPADSYAATSLSVDSGGGAKAVPGATVGRAFFPSTGARPMIGRVFISGDFGGNQTVVVLSEPMWRDSFANDRAIIGRQITISGRPAVVIGVMPKAFDAPPGARLWIPKNDPNVK